MVNSKINKYQCDDDYNYNNNFTIMHIIDYTIELKIEKTSENGIT